ncbi:MAG: VCBS repeat-containing protein, partial [Planctomycetes bacterium]|nr:VCBS repeat-containing protein [Planctomycetota bacterium]
VLIDGEGGSLVAGLNDMHGHVSQEGALLNVAAGTAPRPIVTGDFDSDGILDLAVGTAPGGGGELRILLGQGSDGLGNGTFAAGVTIATGHDITGLVAGDFNGDGITDLVGSQYRLAGGNSLSGVILFAGNGSGGRGDGAFTAMAEIATGTNAVAVAAADFDHDGILDLAVTDADAPALAILIGQGSDGRGNGTFAAPVSVALASAAVALAAADLDSDGIVDLIAVGGSAVSVCFGGGQY